MNIKPIQNYYEDDRPWLVRFGITTKKPFKKYYAHNCWNEITEGKYKDYTFTIYNNYHDKRKGSTLIILKKLGAWIKSKLKYKDINGERKTLWSYADEKKDI